MDDLSYSDILAATAGKIGKVDVACPECGPQARAAINQKRKVLRVWDDGEFATYNCARCGIKGWAKADGTTKLKRAERPRVEHKPDKDTRAISSLLWHRSEPLVASLAEVYLRSRMCFIETQSIRFLRARGEHAPAMLARFGRGAVTGVHITRLRADGRDKAGTEKDKIMLGESMGQPIIVQDNPDNGQLVVAEGIEDAATIANVTGWSAWAAGSWVRMAPAVAAATGYERVYLAVDHDRDGLKALERCSMIRPDIVGLDFATAFGLRERYDANKVLLRFGSDAVRAAIEWFDAKDQFKRGQVGFHAMMRSIANAEGKFREYVGEIA